MRQAVIAFSDGTKDWIDPVLSVIETEEIIEIDNGFNVYIFPKKDVAKIDYVEIEGGEK